MVVSRTLKVCRQVHHSVHIRMRLVHFVKRFDAHHLHPLLSIFCFKNAHSIERIDHAKSFLGIDITQRIHLEDQRVDMFRPMTGDSHQRRHKQKENVLTFHLGDLFDVLRMQK